MARQFWGLVILVQLAIAIAFAVAIGGGSPGMGAWTAVALVVAAFVGIQYLVTALTIVISRALAGERVLQHFAATLQVAFSEPICFGLAQLSMILTGNAQAQTKGSGRSPLLLVHGLACNHGIWRWLIPKLRAAGFMSIHAVDLQPLRGDIDALAGELTREVRRLHQEHGGSGVTIIGHSMGGLIARAALRLAAPQTIRRIITIGTPHHGSAIARALGWLPAKQMCPASPWLAALNASQEGRLPVVLTSICSVDDNLVAPARSPHLEGATVREMHGLGHFGLLFSGRALDCVVQSLERPT